MTDDAYLDVIETLQFIKDNLLPEEAYKAGDLDKAIACVQEHAKYSAIGPIELCRDAVERITPKPPVMKYGCTFRCPPDYGGEDYDEYGDVPHCPNCDREVYSSDDVCRCGQMILRR